MDDSRVVKAGVMVKSPPDGRNILGTLKHWRERYIVLKTSSTSSGLYYYENIQSYLKGDRFKGYINMRDCIDVSEQSMPLSKKDFLVSLRTAEDSDHKGRLFKFSAADQIQQKEWYLAFKKYIKELKEPVELSDENASDDDAAKECFLSPMPTALGKSIDEEKRKLRNLKLDSPSFETTGNEKDAFDCFSQTEEDRSSEKGNDFKKRTSVASSGYESCKTDSIYSDHRSSRTSDCESLLQNINMISYDDNLFEFSTEFEGPRCSTKVKTIVKAKSMGSLLREDNETEIWERQENCRPTLLEQVEIILEKSRKKKTHRMSQPTYNPEQGVELRSNCNTRRRLRSEPGALNSLSYTGNFNEKCSHEASCNRYTHLNTNNEREQYSPSRAAGNVDKRWSLGMAYQYNTADQRPRLPPRQCSKIDERPEEMTCNQAEDIKIQTRSRSDPTGSTLKKKSPVTKVTWFL